ncbi:MAG: hypothetical protein CMP20_04895 [Rickettsiales bacterium]|nr:hypothetical protein [Rickettsiales bacterium]
MDEDYELFPELSSIPFLIPIPVNVDVKVFWVEGQGAMLPHIQAIQKAYINTSGTREHLGNTSQIPFFEGRIVNKPLYEVENINKPLWQQGSNMTLWIVNALCSLAVNVTLPLNFLYNPAQHLNLAPYLGSTPETVFVGVEFSLNDDKEKTHRYSGTIPAGLFLALKIMFTMANTPVTTRNIWGSIDDYADSRIAAYLCKESKQIASGIKSFKRVKEAIDMINLETLVHLSNYAARFIELLAKVIQTPEPIPPNAQLAENCPSCRKRVSTATPRNKLQTTDEEYEPGNDEVIGDMRLVKISVGIGSMRTFRYIYICPHCNERACADINPLRFTRISTKPRRNKRKAEPQAASLQGASKKRKGAKRIQNNIERKLDKIDLIASFFLTQDYQAELRNKTQTIRGQLS